MYAQIFKEAKNMKEEMVQWRRRLHQIPETGLDLPQTAAFVREKLDSFQIPYDTLVNGNCIVAHLGKGEGCLLLRADMDALPMKEETGLPFASQTAVKQNHIRSSYHFHKQGLHIIHINLKGAGVYRNNLLHQSPVLWKLHFFKFADLPHTVVFYDHTFRLIKSIIGYQPLRSQILKFIDHLYTGPAFLQLLRIKFNFAFFTEDQQRRAVYLKIVLLNGKIQESGLAAFQKSCHKIYRNSDFFFHIFPNPFYIIM